LKMPRMSGFDVLVWLATRPEFKNLPAIVLSSSPDQSDIRRAKESGALEYFVKPHSLRELVAILQTLHARWLTELRSEKRDGET
jgi:CheY-like chemotaxis protein